MRVLIAMFLAGGALLIAALRVRASATGPEGAATAGGKPTIFVCGDSTAKNSGNGKNGSPVAGWGTPLAAFFDAEKVTVNNVGHAGTSSRTYYSGDWPNVLPKIGAGDFVLLVFGINDGTTLGGIGEETRPAQSGRGGAPAPGDAVEHTYGWYMAKMATDAQAKGARVYFLTVTTRNIWTNPNPAVKYTDGTPNGTLPADYDPKLDKIERGTGGGRFTEWQKEVGAKLHVPVFDLTNYCADLYETMGREEVNKLYSDHNHTYVPGAEVVASAVVAGLKGFKESPFVGLLSEKGKGVAAADGRYVSDNGAEGAGTGPTGK